MAGDVSDRGRWRLPFSAGYEAADVMSDTSLELSQHATGDVSRFGRPTLALPEVSHALEVL